MDIRNVGVYVIGEFRGVFRRFYFTCDGVINIFSILNFIFELGGWK